MSKDPMSGHRPTKNSPIDRANAEDATVVQTVTGTNEQSGADDNGGPTFADINPHREFLFVPTGDIRINEVQEIILMGVLNLLNGQPPSKGGFQGMKLSEPYYAALSDGAQNFFKQKE